MSESELPADETEEQDPLQDEAKRLVTEEPEPTPEGAEDLPSDVPDGDAGEGDDE